MPVYDVGADEGSSEQKNDGAAVLPLPLPLPLPFPRVGELVRSPPGVPVGTLVLGTTKVGEAVRKIPLGEDVGIAVGLADGTVVGLVDGLADGTVVGLADGVLLG